MGQKMFILLMDIKEELKNVAIAIFLDMKCLRYKYMFSSKVIYKCNATFVKILMRVFLWK